MSVKVLIAVADIWVKDQEPKLRIDSSKQFCPDEIIMWLNILLLSVFGFTNTLTTSFDLRGVINGDRMGGVPLGTSLGAGEVDVEGICSQSGMACQNCTLAVTCVPLPFGWLKVPLQECGEGLTCNAHLGKCSNQPVPECDVRTQDYLHSCEQVGIFPDAHDCRKFHLCSPPDGLPDGRPAAHNIALCPRHYGYNPQNAQCSIQLSKGQCSEKPVPDCAKVGDTGVLPASSNHYYVCLMKDGILHPQVFICPHGWHFWGGYCRPEPNPSTQDLTLKKQDRSTEEKSSEETTVPVTEPTTVVSKIESFFSTEKTTTYAADTFLADKFDLSNYETTDDVQTNNNDFVNSFESSEW